MTHIERIELTASADQKEKLARKLAEYALRLARRPVPRADIATFYKHALLEQLLRNGVVDVDAAKLAEVAAGDFDPFEFDQAVLIVAAYNAGDTTSLRGGTGLR